MLAGLAGACDADELHGVVGWVERSGARHAAVWRDGEMTEIASPADAVESVATTIDASGRIAGWYRLADGTAERSFLFEAGVVRDVGSLGGSEVVVKEISAAGGIAGSATDARERTHAFLGTPDRLRELDGLSATPVSESSAEGSNDDGLVVGTLHPASGVAIGVRFEQGRIDELPHLFGTRTSPRDVNARGQIVGAATAGGEERAIVIAGRAIHALEELVGPEASGWRLLSATGIDDAGEICGYGERDGVLSAFLARPLSGVGLAPPPERGGAAGARPPARNAGHARGHDGVAPASAPAAPATVPAPAVVRSSATGIAGTWQVSGRDAPEPGFTTYWDWSGTLVLDADSNTGTFDWVSNPGGASGRDLVTWSYDASSGWLHLVGHEIEQPVGNICVGTYAIRLAADGVHLVDGTWGAPARPGTWQAQR